MITSLDSDIRHPDKVLLGCFHCGLAVPENASWVTKINGITHSMCCPGCQAVAQSIVDSGLSDYYKNRIGYSITADQQNVVPPELTLYDVKENSETLNQSRFSEDTFVIEGMQCAACVWLIERRLAKMIGIRTVEMNVATGRLHLSWFHEVCKPSDILKVIREIGYRAYPVGAQQLSSQLDKDKKKLFRRVFVAGLSMMQVMMYAFPFYLAADSTIDADMSTMMRWAGFLLTLPAILYSAQPFFAGAWINIKNRLLGMDVPVALGISAAFVGSVAATINGHGDVYYDSVTMFIFLLLCSRYLELDARRKAASALDNLRHAIPSAAFLMTNYPQTRQAKQVAAGTLKSGDIILVKPGEAIAVDGVIIDGQSEVDFSILTGESRAISVDIGKFVPGGALNVMSPIVLRVTEESKNSTLSVLMKLVEKAGSGKPQLALWADRVASWFVTLLLLFAISVFLIWHFIDPTRSWSIAIAVLVVSCPCALSLATPTVLACATNQLLGQGVLIVQSHVLETLNQVTHIIFDKTGTLTLGKPVLTHIQSKDDTLSKLNLRIASSLAVESNHPLSKALVNSVAKKELLLCQTNQHFLGQGVEGWIDGVRYRLGSYSFVTELAGLDHHFESNSNLVSIYLGTENQILSRFDLKDQLRNDAAQLVEYFANQGKMIILLSGDNQSITQHIANELGIKTALGQFLPEQKLDYVKNLQSAGAIVAMVGDGINDAAVLKAADVSFAMGEGSVLTQMHADCILMSGHLLSLKRLNQTASKASAVIHQNLLWAFMYNLIAIPAAALGLLNPWMSAVGMSLSSFFVILNALRLQR